MQAVRKAEERLSGPTAWPESHRQVRAAWVPWRQMQNTKDKSRSGVRIRRTLSVLDRAGGCGMRSESQRKGSENLRVVYMGRGDEVLVMGLGDEENGGVMSKAGNLKRKATGE